MSPPECSNNTGERHRTSPESKYIVSRHGPPQPWLTNITGLCWASCLRCSSAFHSTNKTTHRRGCRIPSLESLCLSRKPSLSFRTRSPLTLSDHRIFSTLVQQIMPRFVIQRSLYEVRERPSKAYSWMAFLVANIVVEIPYQVVLAVLMWISWYFAIFGKNQSSETRGIMLLFVIEFMLFTSTFAHMIIAAMPDAETAGNIATLLFSMMLTFNGVLQSPTALPGFWIFMCM